MSHSESSTINNSAFREHSRKAHVAVDLGAESCRVSLLRWIDEVPRIELIHRFANAPRTADDGSLRWPLQQIVEGVDHGMRLCASLADEGIASVAVDGWAVDYVRLNDHGTPLADPFCYRDARTTSAQNLLHNQISCERMRELTGLSPQPLNTLYQLYADHLAGTPTGTGWLNLPEYLLARWGGKPVSEYTNAAHTQLMDAATQMWSDEILARAALVPDKMPSIVRSGTVLGQMRGPLTDLPAFQATLLIAPACHDTASAIAGIPDVEEDWGYISCGTWSLVGTLLPSAQITPESSALHFTNLGAAGGRILFQKNLNGMWILKQCLDVWADEGRPWVIEELCAACENEPRPDVLLDVSDPELMQMGKMPDRIQAHLQHRGGAGIRTASSDAPKMANLIFRSLAAEYARVFAELEALTNKRLTKIYMVGGGSRNRFLRRLIEDATGRPVLARSPESSTLGNFALQLAALEAPRDSNAGTSHERNMHFAKLLWDTLPVAMRNE